MEVRGWSNRVLISNHGGLHEKTEGCEKCLHPLKICRWLSKMFRTTYQFLKNVSANEELMLPWKPRVVTPNIYLIEISLLFIRCFLLIGENNIYLYLHTVYINCDILCYIYIYLYIGFAQYFRYSMNQWSPRALHRPIVVYGPLVKKKHEVFSFLYIICC